MKIRPVHAGVRNGGRLRRDGEQMRSMTMFKTVRGAALACLGMTVVTAAMLAAPAPARAQIAAVVNGQPITNHDIAQRTRLIQISTRKSPSRKEVLDELIDEKLKLNVAKRYQLDITESDVNSAYAGIAQRMSLSPAQFTQVLRNAGISEEAFKSRVRADLAWNQIIRGKFQASLHVREKDIIAALDKKNDGKGATVYQYTLRPIIFVAPGGSGQRRGEAESLRAKFQNCEQGLAAARGLREVVVRPPVYRSSADFAPAVRAILDKTPVGKLTPPEVTAQGVEVFAVCDKKELAGEIVGKREVREEMVSEQFQAQSKRYLQELRRNAMIEIR
jgi:peptidyl-prolyl cis-trans isomerase SurA